MGRPMSWHSPVGAMIVWPQLFATISALCNLKRKERYVRKETLGSAKRRGRSGRPLIVVAALQDFQNPVATFVSNTVDQTVFLVDATRPPARQIKFQRLGLTDSGERVALDIVDQSVNAVSNFRCVILIVLPSLRSPGNPQRINSCSTNLLASASAMPSCRSRAFAGLLNRYNVSISPSNSSLDTITTEPAALRSM
jgi:hypothetical protein